MRRYVPTLARDRPPSGDATNKGERVVVFLCAARSEGRTGQRAFLAATPRGFSPLVTASRTGRCTVRGSRGASQHATNDISPVVMTD